MFDRRSFLASAAALAAAPVTGVRAQSAWPNRPIRFVVPLAPGGWTDNIARLLAERLPAALGQPVVVENKPGAGGNVGTDFVAKAPPDGYTWLLSPNNHVVSPSLFVKMPYDPLRDFEAVSLINTVPFILAVNSNSQITSMNQLLALARSKPGQVTYGSAGVGSPHHFAGELLRSMTGADIVHVPYKGASGIVPALLSGEITFTIGVINTLLPLIRAGRVRALAVAGPSRIRLLPDLPTMAEAGNLPGYSVDAWYGVLLPGGTPRPIVDRLNAEIVRIVRDPQFIRDHIDPIGGEVVASTPERYIEIMKADLAKYEKIARAANMNRE